MMNDQQLLRYSRQIMLQEVDIAGQEKLLASTVLIVGLGGLGSPVALYLAAAGVGHLVLADFDRVDISNLQRQIAHDEQSIGQLKVESAAEKIRVLNSETKITCISSALTQENIAQEIAKVDLVLDCSDNFTTRLAINSCCVAAKKPLVSGAAIRLEGQVAVFDSRDSTSPCYQCLYGDLQEQDMSCAANGVLAPLVGVIGSMQALEAVKILSGFGQSLAGRLLIFDALTSHWRELRLPKDERCNTCKAS